MKYCENCGAELMDEAVMCPNCGHEVAGATISQQKTKKANPTLVLIAKIFMVIGTISSAFAIIPLIWCIPMTISYFRKTANGEKLGTGFKVCSLLFVNLIAGVLMLVDDAQ